MAEIEVIKSASSNIVTSKDIYLNTGLIGPYNTTQDINVFLQDQNGATVNPLATTYAANNLNAVINIPSPSGVSLEFPFSSQFTSYSTGDTGWRTQNAWFYYTPPAYPAKYAKLKNTVTSEYFYELETPLTVNGITSTRRFVDLAGGQTWSVTGNLNIATLDKLTGLIFLRVPVNISTAGTWANAISNALSYSVTINGITYDDWYCMAKSEMDITFSVFATATNWIDPVSSAAIAQISATPSAILTADTAPSVTTSCLQTVFSTSGFLSQGIASKATLTNKFMIYVHDGRNLIS